MKGVREIILKARRQGFSTLIAILFFLDTINTPNTTSVIVAHDKDTTMRMFKMIKLMYDNLPESKKPPLKTETKNELSFGHNNSTFFIGTAGSDNFGRSDTITNLHCSEVAFWPNGEAIALGLFQAVTRNGNIFMESTANGIGNFYYEEYWKASDKQSAFRAWFSSWFDMDEYRIHPLLAPPFKTVDDLEREAKIKAAYKLDDDQLAFRRAKMREPGMWGKFVQEYPAYPAEAFIASGNPYFDRETLEPLGAVLRGGRYPAIEEIDFGHYDRLHAAHKRGDLVIYNLPEPGVAYCIGADTAEGITTSNTADSCSADVIDARTGSQVAHLHGKWDPHEYGILLAELGHYFEVALLAVERNNHGHAVLNTLIHECDYPNLYEHEEYDQRRAATAKKPGWPTSVKSKTLMLDTLAADTLNGEVRIKHPETVKEMLTFVKKPGGKAGGEGNSHDDRVMSIAIANIIAKDHQVPLLVLPSNRQTMAPDVLVGSTFGPIGSTFMDMLRRRK